MSNGTRYEVSDRRDILPEEIQSLRASVGWDPDQREAWTEALVQARAVRSVHEDESLVGIGFLIGTSRHAIVADVCVNPSYQKRGIGHSIVSALVEDAKDSTYVMLTYNEVTPGLPAFYGQYDFEPINNAMQLRDSNHQA